MKSLKDLGHYGSEGVKACFQLGPHYAETHEPLRRPKTKVSVWLRSALTATKKKFVLRTHHCYPSKITHFHAVFNSQR